ncbi:MAG: regulatory protein RecX [Actinomycetota bacterium]
MTATAATRRGPRQAKNPKSCHERALGLLAVRPRARRELERRLLAAGFEADEVSDVLTRLERARLIDDKAFAKQLAEHQFGARRAGSRAVKSALLAKGIAPDLAAEVAGSAPDDEQERATELARSRVGRLAGVEPVKAFGRLTSLLVRRGYSPEVARLAARRVLEVDDRD